MEDAPAKAPWGRGLSSPVPPSTTVPIEFTLSLSDVLAMLAWFDTCVDETERGTRLT